MTARITGQIFLYYIDGLLILFLLYNYQSLVFASTETYSSQY
ncbi:hypothetical protein PROSTU_04004 [Providencia stuartii ATCC 25827]|uniref:Uncharacterized protein n=1 Tax=Providencia stuartii ATCC 25827 TaxID=471874 RepID=A0AA86YWS6_PROST|nr:hypothetical protein PROSTU_04004 [Providencia stuartii ATCC 25827]